LHYQTIYERHDLIETLAAKKRPPNIFNVFCVKIKAEDRSVKMNMMLPDPIDRPTAKLGLAFPVFRSCSFMFFP